MGMTGRVATRPRFKNQARGRRGFRAANVMRRNRAGSTAPAQRVGGIVGGREASRQSRRIQTVSACDPTEPRR